MATLSQHCAASVLKHDGIIAHQTDTIFGLACLPRKVLLNRLSCVKKRPQNKTFLLLASHLDQISDYISVSESESETLKLQTEVPTTWLVNAAENIATNLIGQNNKIAVRITSFEPIHTLCQQVGAIASTSANISNFSVCTSTNQIRTMFGPNIDYIDPNQTSGTGKSSTIIDLSSGDIIRE